MSRPNWDEYFMLAAKLAATRSTCLRLKVGCVIVLDKHIVSTGYNGTPDGCVHCDEAWNYRVDQDNLGKDFLKSEEFRKLHHEWSLNNEIHAEQNAIAFAARLGLPTQNATLYVTHSPCINCAKLIVQTGIKRVVYLTKYDRGSQDSLDLFKNSGILCDEFIGNIDNFIL
jgi:dCMP deaminase